MLDWTDEQKMLRDALREFALREVVPLVGELEHGDLPPYDTLRKLFAAAGRTIPSSWATPASARPRSPKAWLPGS